MSTATLEEKNGTHAGAGNEVAVIPKGQARLMSRDDSQFSAILDLPKFEQLQNVAKLFAASSLVPEQFRGNMPNCFVAMQMALRLGVDPLMFMQASYIVHGRPGIEGKLAIALANASGVFKGPIQYRMEGEGKSRRCTAYAVVADTGERVEMTVDWTMVEAEGWDKKSGSKWKTMPEIMFRYRAAMFLIRTHCPEVIMGLQSKEELEDVEQRQPVNRLAGLTGGVSSLDSLADRLAGASAEETSQATDESTQESPVSSDELAPDLVKFRDTCATAEKILHVNAADEALRGPNGRELTADEAALADAWKQAAHDRIHAGRGDRTNPKPE